MSEGRLRYPVPQKVGNDIVTVIVEKNGPVAFMVTTTRTHLHDENETRMLSIETDDSPEQTRRVLGEGRRGRRRGRRRSDRLRQMARLPALAGGRRAARRHPVGEDAGEGSSRARRCGLRRDFGQLLRAVKAHALLHRFHRERDDKGRIVATIAELDDGEAGAPKVEGDYEAIRELFADILAEASESRSARRLWQPSMRSPRCSRTTPQKDLSGNILKTEGATTPAVAEVLAIDRTTAFRRLRAAERKRTDRQPREKAAEIAAELLPHAACRGGSGRAAAEHRSAERGL